MDDDILFFLLFPLLAIGVFAAVMAGIAEENSQEDRFRQACADRGGFLAETGSGWSTRIDCIVDNKIVYLPGFE
ncbi:hypothetical protein BJD55_gp048 [Gordonia phage Yvonnetastic]|uniref:Uncharacterized protein n=1 Tax=Gordonia phage Yvonnetastic TaxID=1821566 RepID=A0A142K9D5_9CAUD|nr:hypothetical protein BJD55_gp048 [Gordonia phage Yvonnetastic]AMS02718.1 hypothetical protein SEA_YVONNETASTIC_174 [Gordonia phage Yvonnetastic]